MREINCLYFLIYYLTCVYHGLVCSTAGYFITLIMLLVGKFPEFLDPTVASLARKHSQKTYKERWCDMDVRLFGGQADLLSTASKYNLKKQPLLYVFRHTVCKCSLFIHPRHKFLGFFNTALDKTFLTFRQNSRKEKLTKYIRINFLIQNHPT